MRTETPGVDSRPFTTTNSRRIFVMSSADSAIFWIAGGFFPVPIPYREKGPKIENWHTLDITAADVPRYLNSAPQNIGLLLGEPYGNCDIDLDCAQAVAAFPHFAPDTGL